ncbi:phosphatidylserine decarboxylase [Seinonella peptonophila]|uniref:Phosphatidylserine decarboxylase proenzyme n=1 Tax=Seinonella peptonophila TaxID=112248 RepID=A0A1M4WCK5_9BACL|nr:archaetidylserine decarboxylase [Seinonella peptonophila]SHE78880.1 phosphatidylserine decarboxylase [Seinonella peptonophila]
MKKLLWKITPKKHLSRLVGKFARHSWSRGLIPLYIKAYRIDLEPIKKSVDQFENLLDFFIREYKPEARPLVADPQIIVSPVDGKISQAGSIEKDMLLQAKGVNYSLMELLANRMEHIERYIGGKFITIYLSPRDYHRIHMPITGAIEEFTYIPGELYPVNEWGVQFIPGLFARNERLITYIRTDNGGEVALIKVGATNVGSIRVEYDDQISTNKKGIGITHKCYSNPHKLHKGEELGRFEFGSTIILLFEPNQVDWVISPIPGTVVQMGQALARRK